MVAALPANERAAWATAFYAGLRRGELIAIRWTEIDFGRSEIHDLRSWDQYDGEIETKSETSERTVPILAVLRSHLAQHKLATGRGGTTSFSGVRRSFPSFRQRCAAGR